MKQLIFIILIALFSAVAVSGQTSIKPAAIYDQNGITVVSPNQPEWILLKTDKSETSFEKRGEDGILSASVKIIKTKIFETDETDKERLAGWEAIKQEELGKLKQDHLHFNNVRFKGMPCLLYDGIFPLDKTSSNKFAHFNVTGYVCPNANAKDSAVQMEFSNYSNIRGLTEDLGSLREEFFENIVFPKATNK